jgi:hypothetical protein
MFSTHNSASWVSVMDVNSFSIEVKVFAFFLQQACQEMVF